MTARTQMRGMYLSEALVDGVAVIKPMWAAPVPATVSVVPVAGDTIEVSYSLDDGVTYILWENGAVTSASSDAEKQIVFYSGITHLKFQRTVGAGTTSTFSVC